MKIARPIAVVATLAVSLFAGSCSRVEPETTLSQGVAAAPMPQPAPPRARDPRFDRFRQRRAAAEDDAREQRRRQPQQQQQRCSFALEVDHPFARKLTT